MQQLIWGSVCTVEIGMGTDYLLRRFWPFLQALAAWAIMVQLLVPVQAAETTKRAAARARKTCGTSIRKALEWQLTTAARERSKEFKITGKEKSLRDLEPLFEMASRGESFELVIPKTVQLRLFPTEPAFSVKYAEKRVDYFPYFLNAAETEDSKHLHDLLDSVREALYKIEKSRKESRPLSQVWTSHHQKRYYFTQSPTTAKSMTLYQKPDRLLSLTERTNRVGRYPFLHVRRNGDMVLTNQHFMRHLKKSGLRQVTLFRGHGAFDHFFYNLLFEKGIGLRKKRLKFAQWLRSESTNLSIQRNVSREKLSLFASRLEAMTVPVEDVLSEISREMTTSAMFTSLATDHSEYWAQGKLSEVLTLNLDLQKVPEWYLDQISYGADLDVEVVFPFATREQLEALRNSISISTQR